MLEVNKTDLNRLRILFKEIRFHMGYSVLDGKMGKAYVDNIEKPEFAILLVRSYCFMSGKIKEEQLKSTIEKYELQKYRLIPSDEIKEMLEKIYDKEIEKFQRYSIKKDTVFNIKQLKIYANNNMINYSFKRINKELADRIKREKFINITDNYKEEGIGYCCIYNDDIIGVASSNIIYNDGIEVNIKVKEEFRRRGIATIMASKLILACLEENKTISWDAANLNSVGLAKKLGFEYDSTYDIYNIKNIDERINKGR